VLAVGVLALTSCTTEKDSGTDGNSGLPPACEVLEFPVQDPACGEALRERCGAFHDPDECASAEPMVASNGVNSYHCAWGAVVQVDPMTCAVSEPTYHCEAAATTLLECGACNITGVSFPSSWHADAAGNLLYYVPCTADGAALGRPIDRGDPILCSDGVIGRPAICDCVPETCP
jgi:hypothetical protein